MLKSLRVAEEDLDEVAERVRLRWDAANARLLRALGLRVWIADAEVGRGRGKARVELKAEGLKGDEGSALGMANGGEGDGGDNMISDQDVRTAYCSSNDQV